MLGALLVWGPTCQLGGLCEGSVFPEFPFLSVQLAKFSEDTLSSYTEAVSTQVHSPGQPCPRSLLERWTPPLYDLLASRRLSEPRVLMSHGQCVAAPPGQMPPHPSFQVPLDHCLW